MFFNFPGKSFKFNLVCRFFTREMGSEKCKVAVCQFTASNNKLENLETVRKLVAQAADQEAQMVFLPEGCDYIGTNKEETRGLAEPLSGPVMTEYRNLAKSHNIWLSVGGFHELVALQDQEPKFYNSHVIIDDTGEIRSVYKKIHLFDVSIPEKDLHLKESEFTQCGSEIVPPVETPAGPLALAICYDLRFPELSTLQRKLGANILTYPSAFTNTTGKTHWEVLLKARAIENQCYVIAAAQYGCHNEKRTSFGQALIVDPWGEIVAQCPRYNDREAKNQSIAVAEIDSALVEKIRREMPVLTHRRQDIYELKLSSGKISASEIRDQDIYWFADKKIPGATVFYRTKYSFAFTNIRCVVPGHVLVSCLRPARRLQDLSPEEIGDLFKTAVQVQKVMEQVHNSDSTTVCVQDGKNAGQTVPHVHVHILPRQPHDFDRNDDVYERLAKHEQEGNTIEPLRDIPEMAAEAALLRPHFGYPPVSNV